MPPSKQTTIPGLPRRKSQTPNQDDSSINEDTPLSQIPRRKQTHPGQPKVPQPRATSTTSSINTFSTTTASRSNHNSSSTTEVLHKPVNANSTNRRQCKRTSDNLSRSTPDCNNLSQRKHSFSTRLTLKLNVEASDDLEKKLLQLFAEFAGELISANSTSAVLPWKSIDRNKAHITKSSDIPINTKLLRTYLNRFYLNRTPNTQFITYPGIHIGHNKQLSEIREEMQHWMQDGDHGLFYKMLQVEESAEIGWFLYSTREMDAGALVDEIQDLVGVKIGLRWKIIDVGVKGKLPESQRVRALNVEVDSKHRWESQRTLLKYFGRNIKKLTDYPNGIRLRFVKNKNDGINNIEKGKIEKLRARQKAFLATIVSKETWDMIQIDYASAPNQPTLRQMIMELKSADVDIPLFHCVDLDWSGNGYIFQFSPSVKVEAECTINTLLPLLKHKYPEAEVEKHFSQETIERSEGYKFDPIKGIVVDDFIDDNLQFIDEDNLLGFAFDTAASEIANDPPIERPSVPQALYNDSDSVSTLAQPGRMSYTTPAMHNNVSFTQADPRSSDNTSVTSGTSTVTMGTINSIIDNKFSEITAHIKNNDKKFEALLELIQSNKAGESSSPPNHQTCTPAVSSSKAGVDNNTSTSSDVQ
jgi:hypothetical protein